MKKLSILFFFSCTQFFASAQWYQLNSGTDAILTGVFFINNDTGFVVGHHYNTDSGIVLKTTNGGLTWDSLDYGPNQNVFSVSFPSEQVGYICGWGFIKKTTDQGNTWTDVTSPYNYYYDSDFRQLQFINDSVGYVLDYSGHDFQKTTDGGLTWTILPCPFEKAFYFYFSSEDTGMVADLDDEFEVKVTHDGCLTWTQSLVGGVYGNAIFCVTYVENQKWVAIRDAFYADITTDNGQTWTDWAMDSVPPQESVKDVVFPTASDGWAVGTRYIINSHDGGYSWAVNDSTPDSLIRVFFPNAQVGYAVGDDGLIMKYVAPGYCSTNFNLVADTLIPHHYWGVNTSTGTPPFNYYWSWGDGSYDSIPYPSHIYASGGFYTICLTIHDTTGCIDSTCYSYQIQKMSYAEAENTMVYVDIVPNIPTIVQNFETQRLLFFPNPVETQLRINLTSAPDEVFLCVYDLHGRKISLPTTFAYNQMQLNTASLPNGFYTVQITNNKTGVIEAGKFVKQ